MVLMVPPPPPEVQRPLEQVLQRATAAIGQAPPWILVEDTEGRWLQEVAARSACERRAAVIAVQSEAALVRAIRLEIGGALWLPPSTAAMQQACLAAGRCTAHCAGLADSQLVETLFGDQDKLLLVTWRQRRFWRRQLGESAMTATLQALARSLAAVPSVLPWPLLLVTGIAEATIREAASLLPEQPPLHCLPLPPVAERGSVISEAFRTAAAAEWVEQVQVPARRPPQPVCELPSGRLVGRWADGILDDECTPAQGWLAEPVALLRDGFRWRLRGAGQPEQTVVDIVSGDEMAKRAADGVVRLCGWAARTIHPGSPAGLLLQRLVQQAGKLEITLWLPHLDQQTLQLLLREGGGTRLWVDGPAVPGSG